MHRDWEVPRMMDLVVHFLYLFSHFNESRSLFDTENLKEMLLLIAQKLGIILYIPENSYAVTHHNGDLLKSEEIKLQVLENISEKL
jgi:hypothetical protein